MAAVGSNARLAQHTRMTTPLLVDLALSNWPNPTWTCEKGLYLSFRLDQHVVGDVFEDDGDAEQGAEGGVWCGGD